MREIKILSRHRPKLGPNLNFEKSKYRGMVRMGVGRFVGRYFIAFSVPFCSFYDGLVTFERCDWRRGFLGVSDRK